MGVFDPGINRILSTIRMMEHTKAYYLRETHIITPHLAQISLFEGVQALLSVHTRKVSIPVILRVLDNIQMTIYQVLCSKLVQAVIHKRKLR